MWCYESSSTSLYVRLCKWANLICQIDVLITLYVANAAHIVPMPTFWSPASARYFNLSMYAGTVKKNMAYIFRRKTKSFWPNNEPSPAHISPFTIRNNPTPGMAPFTLCKTNASEVKYRLIKGIIDTRETSSKPKLAPTFRKLFTVFCKALALATLRSLIPCIAGTKLCATWLSAYNVTESDVRRLWMDNEKFQ